MSVSVRIFINRYSLDKDGKAKVSICVTHNRIKRYYPLDLKLEPDHFDKIITAERRSKKDREIYDLMQAAEVRAKEVVNELPIFTFELFDQRFKKERATIGTVAGAFDNYINELHSFKRYNTAINYTAAKKSIETYKKSLKFADITPTFLKKYEQFMIDEVKSITTVGIYLRCLRTIFNNEKIDRSIYPFGAEKEGKYTIPKGKNIKKALRLQDVHKIANYKPKTPMEEFARDFWILSFQCNGMNIKDILHLKQSDIKGDILKYTRAKTISTKNEVKPIVVSLKPESKEIISRWGNKTIGSKQKDPFVFDILKPDMTPKEVSARVKQTVKNINKYMKRIGEVLEIEGDVKTYAARHSYATILKKAGASIEFISEGLGHSSLATTESYLASFEDEAIHKQTEILTGLKMNA